jgi:hypothetical protein
VLSGPIAFAVVAATHPQPPWSGAEAFAANYHPIQTLPYFFGFLLVGGFVALVASLHELASTASRARTSIAALLTAAFAAMIFINYAIQTTVVPALLSNGTAENLALAGQLTMANSHSLGWALEMWGYAVLGVATWLVAPVFHSFRFGRPTSVLFVVNAPISVLGAVATAIAPGWVLTVGGLYVFGLWNLLVIAMLTLAMEGLRNAQSAA